MKKRDVLCGAILCFAGGAIDGYSYTMRGGVIAAAQTANLLRMALSAAEGDWSHVFRYIIPIICFMAATYVAKLIREVLFHKDDFKWQRSILFMEVIVFFILGFGSDNTPTNLVNAIISFFAAMQYCAFRSFGKNAPYATVFCTGNMRSLIDNVYEGSIHHERESWKRTVGYVIMLLAFSLGVGSCSILGKIVGHYAIWLASGAIIFVIFLQGYFHKEKKG